MVRFGVRTFLMPSKGHPGAQRNGRFHSLDSGGYTGQNDRHVESLGLLPLVGDLLPESDLLILIEFSQCLEGCGVLGDKSALAEYGSDVVHVVLSGKIIDLRHEGIAGHAGERVANPSYSRGQL